MVCMQCICAVDGPAFVDAHVQGWLFMLVWACAGVFCSLPAGALCVCLVCSCCPAPLQQQQTNFDDSEQDCFMTRCAQVLDTQEHAPGRCAARQQEVLDPACLPGFDSRLFLAPITVRGGCSCMLDGCRVWLYHGMSML